MFKARGEVFSVPLNTYAAVYSRDALAKRIYSNIFDYLVETVNNKTHIAKNDNIGTISILDIFGFEAFDVNRFEQLCINYANEKMQAKYTTGMCIFTLVRVYLSVRFYSYTFKQNVFNLIR